MKYMEGRCMAFLLEVPCPRRVGQLMALAALTSGVTWTQLTGKSHVSATKRMQVVADPLAMLQPHGSTKAVI